MAANESDVSMSPQELRKHIGRLIAETLREFEQATGIRVYALDIERGLAIEKGCAGRIKNVEVKIGAH